MRNFMPLTLTIFRQNKTTNSEILGIIWFCTFPDFVHARFHKICIEDILISMLIFATKHCPWIIIIIIMH